MHKTMRNFFQFNILMMCLALSACVGASLPVIKPFKMDIQQGNVVTSKMLLQLRPGMTKSQVKFIMGSPLINDSFHTNRWDYFYQLRQAGRVVEQRRVILDFDKDLLTKVRGDVVPQAASSANDAATGAVVLAKEPASTYAKTKPKEGVFENLKFWKDKEKEAAQAPTKESAKESAKDTAKLKASDDKGLLEQLKFWKKADVTAIAKPNLTDSDIKNKISAPTVQLPLAVLPKTAESLPNASLPEVNAIETNAIENSTSETSASEISTLENNTADAPSMLAIPIDILPAVTASAATATAIANTKEAATVVATTGVTTTANTAAAVKVPQIDAPKASMPVIAKPNIQKPIESNASEKALDTVKQADLQQVAIKPASANSATAAATAAVVVTTVSPTAIITPLKTEALNPRRQDDRFSFRFDRNLNTDNIISSKRILRNDKIGNDVTQIDTLTPSISTNNQQNTLPAEVQPSYFDKLLEKIGF